MEWRPKEWRDEQHPRGPSYPDLLRADTYEVPEPLRARSDGDLEPTGIDRARYLST
jgi:hypothetical protein